MLHSRYRDPWLVGIRRRWLAVMVLFGICMLLTLLLIWIHPPDWRQVLTIGGSIAVGLSAIFALLLSLSGSVTLGSSKIIRRSVLGRTREIDYHAITAILTVPGASHAKTYILSDDPFHSFDEFLTNLPGAFRLFVGKKIESSYHVLQVVGSGKSGIVISAQTQRYPELLTELVQRCPSAFIDPFTRLVLDAISLAPLYQHIHLTSMSCPMPANERRADLARRHFSQFDLPGASNSLQSIQEESRSSEDWHLLGVTYLLLRAPSYAALCLGEAATLHPDSPPILRHLGLAYYCSGDWVLAHELFEKARQIGSSESGDLAVAGCAAVCSRQWEVAHGTFDAMETGAGLSIIHGIADQCRSCANALRDPSLETKQSDVQGKPRWLKAVAFILAAAGFAAEMFLDDIGWIPAWIVVCILIGWVQHLLERRYPAEAPAYPLCFLNMGWTRESRDEVESSMQVKESEIEPEVAV